MSYYPVCLDLREEQPRVVLGGGGEVAARKVAGLLTHYR
jgi:siroheme synthase (precorrin-2 oxidase/ferrochelatase)